MIHHLASGASFVWKYSEGSNIFQVAFSGRLSRSLNDPRLFSKVVICIWNVLAINKILNTSLTLKEINEDFLHIF